MAFTNGRAPRVVKTATGLQPPVVTTATVDTSTTAAGDFVGPMAAGAWPVYVAKGAILGGIFLSTDPGYISAGGVSLPTPGIDAAPTATLSGVYGADGSAAVNSGTLGAVQLITPDCYVEVDILEGLDMSTLLPGLVMALIGATRASASSGGWYLELDATSANALDACCTLMEVLYPAQAAQRGRAIVRFNKPSVLACQFNA